MSEESKNQISLTILNKILDQEDFEEKIYDISNIVSFARELPEETTILKLIKSKENFNELIRELLDNVSHYVNSGSLFTVLNNILNNITSNTEFDYYKEINNAAL